MARKPHKFAHNGVTLTTALSERDLREICALAADQSRGDLWKGSHRIAESATGDGFVLYVVKDALLGWSKFMTFSVTFESNASRTLLETEIQNYMTTHPTVSGIPVGPKRMVAHHTYVQFLHKLANTVHEADPTAVIAMSENEAPAPAPPRLDAAVEAQPSAAPLDFATAIPISRESHAASEPVANADADGDGDGQDSVPDERTAMVPRRSRSIAWYLEPDGLQRVRVDGAVLVGRDPSGAGTLVPVPADETSVSKTHARVELVDGTLRVVDLESTNGTFLVDQFDDMLQCEPGSPTPIGDATAIEVGTYSIAVHRIREDAA
jgi:hypothetical protein